MRSVQDCLSRKLWKFKRKMEDNFINISGTRCKCAIINVVMDKYQNTCQSVSLSGFADVVMDFPDNDIPTSTMITGYDIIYDLLPISAYFKNEDIKKYNIRKDSVILLKLRMFDDSFQMLKLQVVDAVSKGDASSGTYHHNFVVAPITSYELLNDVEFKSLIEEAEHMNGWDF